MGYDHKKMAITARGAWEAVQRHFSEMGKNIQERPFRGRRGRHVGRRVRQRHAAVEADAADRGLRSSPRIFIDPDPDPARSWEERARIFALPRSSWDDYDKSLPPTMD